MIESMLAFRPWRPRTWPAAHKLIALLLAIAALKSASPVQVLLELTSIWAPLRWLLSSDWLAWLLGGSPMWILLTTALLIKLKCSINQRQEAVKIFERIGVPSVANTNLLSGNMFDVILPLDNLQRIDGCHQELGQTFGLFYGPDPWLFTTDLDLLQRIFVSEGSKHIDVTQFRLPFITEINESLAQLSGNKWRQTRRLLDPSFTQHQMKSDNVHENISRACGKLVDCIEAHELDDQSATRGRPVDVLLCFKKYALEVIFQVAYGCEYSNKMEPNEPDELVDAVEKGAVLISGPLVWTGIMFASTQRLLGVFAPLTPLGCCIRYIHRRLEASLAKRRIFLQAEKSNRQRGQRKMIDSIIERFDSGNLNDKMLKANLFFIFIAGFETTANTLTIMFWLLAKHPDTQEKLRAELIAAGEQSQYLEQCIQETLRLYPAVPTAIGRILAEDVEFNGLKYPKGLTVNASIYSIHHSPGIWGEQVEEFRPERFAELAGQMHPAQYFAFGIGPRYCLGTNLALAEMRTVVTRLLLKYRVVEGERTPEKLNITSPNLIHMIIHGRVELTLIELSELK